MTLEIRTGKDDKNGRLTSHLVGQDHWHLTQTDMYLYFGFNLFDLVIFLIDSMFSLQIGDNTHIVITVVAKCFPHSN